MNRSRFIYGSILMVFMNIFVRIIGFTYEILLSKYLGAEAMGLFEIAISLLMIFLILINSGTSTSVTKLVAEQNSKNNIFNIEKIHKTSLTLNFITAIILGFIIYLFSDYISIQAFKNKDMIFGVYLIIPALIFISLSSSFKAYFYGLKNIVIPSSGEIIENTTKLIVIMIIIYFVYPIEPLYGAILAIFGISIGEFFNLIWFIYFKLRVSKKKTIIHSKKEKREVFLVKILLMSMPLTISGFLSAILRFLNTILIPNRLMSLGLSNSEALSSMGRIMGMTMPLIGMPFIVTNALVVNLIPSLTEQVVLKKYKEIRNDIQLSLKVTLLVSIPLASVYIVLSKSLAHFLYNDLYVAKYIQIMGVSTILIALQHNFTGILYGINKQVIATITRLLGMIVQVFVIYFLVGNSKFGINGIFISYYCSFIFILFFDILTLRKSIRLNLDYFDILGKPILASLFMVLMIYLSNFDLSNLQNSNGYTFILSLLVAGLAYILVLVLTKALPKGFLKKSYQNRLPRLRKLMGGHFLTTQFLSFFNEII